MKYNPSAPLKPIIWHNPNRKFFDPSFLLTSKQIDAHMKRLAQEVKEMTGRERYHRYLAAMHNSPRSEE